MVKPSTFILIFLSQLLLCQSESGFYMNWNRDHMGRTTKPTIRISKEEAKVINCYWVEFDAQQSFSKDEYEEDGNFLKRDNRNIENNSMK